MILKTEFKEIYMPLNADVLVKEASGLPYAERAKLVDALLTTLDPVTEDDVRTVLTGDPITAVLGPDAHPDAYRPPPAQGRTISLRITR